MVDLRPIPWAFLDHDYLKSWVWKTEHFEARVTSDLNSFSWMILDLIRNPDGAFLMEGRSRDFQAAETEIREVIGKSYPIKYGYGDYAGHLATTFTIATGERVDFGMYVVGRAAVTVRFPDGRDQTFVGGLRVHHYEIWLRPETGAVLRIQPAHIVKVVGEGGGARHQPKTAYTGMGRVYHGSVRPGCTGVPGFLPDTVDHTGPSCPAHED